MDISRFVNFVKNKNLFQIALATIISDRIIDITSVFMNSIILVQNYEQHIRNPTYSPKNKLETIYFDIVTIRIEIGKIIFVVLKFMIVLYLMYIFALLFCETNS
jgi:large-conductance mechanosensitive channel